MLFHSIRKKIKLAKVAAVIISILFVSMIASNIHLNCKVLELEKEIELLK